MQITNEHSQNINGRKCIFPSANTFQDLFETAKVWEGTRRGGEPTKPHTWTYAGEDMLIGPYCSIRESYDSLAVRARDKVIDTIKRHTIHVDNDSMSFEIIHWDEDRALVLCSHSVIIGSVWLAIIDPSTVPVFEETE